MALEIWPRKESLWRQVVEDKYGIVSEWELKSSLLPYGWGSKTTFWVNRWCSSKPLLLEYPTLYRLARNKEVMVEDYWVPLGEGGIWNMDLRKGLDD